MNECRGARFDVDTPEPVALNSSEYYLAGWFVPAPEKIDGQLILLELDGVFTPVTTGIQRNDVVRHFRDPDVAESGFITRFPAPRLLPIVRLVLQDGNDRINIAQFTVSLDVSDAVTRKAGRSPGVGNSRSRDEDDPSLWPSWEVGERLSGLTYRPVVSVVIILRSSSTYLTNRCVTSVLEQYYANLQLIVVLNGVPMSVVKQVERYASADSRVHLIRPEASNSIRECLANAIEEVIGDYVIWMGEDEELHKHAVIEIVRHLNMAQNVPDLVYTDEDHIDVYGSRSKPILKSDFDREKLFSLNYFGRLTAIRSSVFPEAGNLRMLVQDDEFWDLVVRLGEVRNREQIHHIPKVLYHRRLYDSTTCPPGYGRPINTTARVAVVAGHIQRTGKTARAEQADCLGFVRTRYVYPQQTRTAIFIRRRDGAWQYSTLHNKTDRSTTHFYEISGCAIRRLGTNDSVPALPCIDTSELKADVLLFINLRVETVNQFFFRELIAHAMRSDCGVVTGISLDRHRRVLHSGFEAGKDGQPRDRFEGLSFPIDTDGTELDVVRTVDVISGHFFALRPQLLDSIGGLPLISEFNADRVANAICNVARQQGMRALVTPYAIATLDCADCDDTGVLRSIRHRSEMISDELRKPKAAQESHRNKLD